MPPAVVTTDRDAIRRVMTGDPLSKRHGNDVVRPLIGDGSVMLLEPAEHLARRKLPLPPFHGERVRVDAQLMQQLTNRAIDRWGVSDSVAPLPVAQDVTIEVILHAVLGVADADMRERFRRLIDDLLLYPIAGLPRRANATPALGVTQRRPIGELAAFVGALPTPAMQHTSGAEGALAAERRHLGLVGTPRPPSNRSRARFAAAIDSRPLAQRKYSAYGSAFPVSAVASNRLPSANSSVCAISCLLIAEPGLRIARTDNARIRRGPRIFAGRRRAPARHAHRKVECASPMRRPTLPSQTEPCQAQELTQWRGSHAKPPDQDHPRTRGDVRRDGHRRVGGASRGADRNQARIHHDA
jgi:hypothetical protein